MSWRREAREFWLSYLVVQKQRNITRQEIQDEDRNFFSCSVYFFSGTCFLGNCRNQEFNKIAALHLLFKSLSKISMVATNYDNVCLWKGCLNYVLCSLLQLLTYIGIRPDLAMTYQPYSGALGRPL